MPGVNGGIGNHVYGATQWSDEQRLKRMMFGICEMYEELAGLFGRKCEWCVDRDWCDEDSEKFCVLGIKAYLEREEEECI